MMHCRLGPGPSAVGGVFGPPSPDHDPKHDVLAALARWVEQGEPPETIIALRPWRPCPAVARFSGKGEHRDAANFACAAPSE